jgi:hypothetical protein
MCSTSTFFRLQCNATVSTCSWATLRCMSFLRMPRADYLTSAVARSVLKRIVSSESRIHNSATCLVMTRGVRKGGNSCITVSKLSIRNESYSFHGDVLNYFSSLTSWLLTHYSCRQCPFLLTFILQSNNPQLDNVNGNARKPEQVLIYSDSVSYPVSVTVLQLVTQLVLHFLRYDLSAWRFGIAQDTDLFGFFALCSRDIANSSL